MNRVLITLALLGALACQKPRQLKVRATTCGLLCGQRDQPSRDPRSFVGVNCAAAARIRVLDQNAAPDAGPLGEDCVPLPNGLDPLFDTGPDAGPASPALLKLSSHRGPATVEIALYAPGTAGVCPADAPFVAIGQSATFDLSAPPSTPLLVPLGCHELCVDTPPPSITVSLASLEPGQTAQPLPSVITVGDIYAYEPLVSTGGLCAATPPSESRPHGEFRAFNNTAPTGNVFTGLYPEDPYPFAGCLALRLGGGSTNSYACLSRSGSDVQGWVLSSSDQAAVLSLHPPASDERNGLLVVGVVDAAGAPAIGATLHFALTGEAPYYVAADYRSASQTSGLTSAGIAFFADAPTGKYFVNFPNGSNVYFNAGAGEPGTLTTWLVACAPRACSDVPNSCGPILDGCGGTIDCGNCPAGQACNQGVCNCIPTTCGQVGAGCGPVSDGCGRTLDCGGCAAPLSCGAINTNQCGCITTTCAAVLADCGVIPDGCGGSLNCDNGTCVDVCGGGSGPNVCGQNPCTPLNACPPGVCGVITDQCSDVLNCDFPTPVCQPPETCGGGGTANQCGCLPTTCDAQGATCGQIDDGCGNTLTCGACPTNQTCGGGGANRCG